MPADNDNGFALPAEGRSTQDPLGGQSIDILQQDPALLSLLRQAEAQGRTNAAPNSAADFRQRRKQGFTVTLPSGLNALVRRTFDLFAKMEKGDIPNPLAGIVAQMISGEKEAFTPEEMGAEAMNQMLSLYDETLEAMMIVPKFQCRPADAGPGWEPDDDAITSEDLELEDKVFLFNVAQGGAADLERFRAQSEAFMAAAQHGEGVPVQAEQSD